MFLYFLYFIWGISFGSFLNVITYRLPSSISIIKPRSFCTNCKSIIPFYYNIPLISFLLLKGKCYECKKNISFQYPLIELITGLLFIVSFYNYNFFESLFFILISCILLCIAVIDYYHYIISLRLSSFLFSIILFYIFFYSNYIFHLSGALIGLGYLTFIFLVTRFISKKQPLGYGDLILIVILGLWLGTLKILLTIFFSALFGLLFWLLITMIYGYEKNRKLPFGTFLSLTAIILFLIDLNLFI